MKCLAGIDYDVAPVLEKPKKLTLEVVRATGVEAAQKYGKEVVKAILDSLGEVGMTSMAPENYGAFMRKLGELDGMHPQCPPGGSPARAQ